MDLAEQQARIDAIAWYHDFDFGHGLTARALAPAADIHRPMWRFIEAHLDGIDFRGKTVLDLGCWDGYWSFYAERRGARSVLAADDASQNWSDGRGVYLAKELLASKVEINRQLSVYDLALLGRKFDIVLFLGVYYHLLAPYYALAQIRHCCHADSLVLIEGNEGLGLPAKGAIFDLDKPTSKFLPSRGALQELLRAAYFSVTAAESMDAPFGTEPPSWGWRLRMSLAALRGARAAVADLVQPLLAIRRVFVVGKPTTGPNDAHYYKPPFGLHVYDGRFDGA